MQRDQGHRNWQKGEHEQSEKTCPKTLDLIYKSPKHCPKGCDTKVIIKSTLERKRAFGALEWVNRSLFLTSVHSCRPVHTSIVCEEGGGPGKGGRNGCWHVNILNHTLHWTWSKLHTHTHTQTHTHTHTQIPIASSVNLISRLLIHTYKSIITKAFSNIIEQNKISIIHQSSCPKTCIVN